MYRFYKIYVWVLLPINLIFLLNGVVLDKKLCAVVLKQTEHLFKLSNFAM